MLKWIGLVTDMMPMIRFFFRKCLPVMFECDW